MIKINGVRSLSNIVSGPAPPPPDEKKKKKALLDTGWKPQTLLLNNIVPSEVLAFILPFFFFLFVFRSRTCLFVLKVVGCVEA